MIAYYMYVQNVTPCQCTDAHMHVDDNLLLESTFIYKLLS